MHRKLKGAWLFLLIFFSLKAISEPHFIIQLEGVFVAAPPTSIANLASYAQGFSQLPLRSGSDAFLLFLLERFPNATFSFYSIAGDTQTTQVLNQLKAETKKLLNPRIVVHDFFEDLFDPNAIDLDNLDQLIHTLRDYNALPEPESSEEIGLLLSTLDIETVKIIGAVFSTLRSLKDKTHSIYLNDIVMNHWLESFVSRIKYDVQLATVLTALDARNPDWTHRSQHVIHVTGMVEGRLFAILVKNNKNSLISAPGQIPAPHSKLDSYDRETPPKTRKQRAKLIGYLRQRNGLAYRTAWLDAWARDSTIEHDADSLDRMFWMLPTHPSDLDRHKINLSEFDESLYARRHFEAGVALLRKHEPEYHPIVVTNDFFPRDCLQALSATAQGRRVTKLFSPVN